MPKPVGPASSGESPGPSGIRRAIRVLAGACCALLCLASAAWADPPAANLISAPGVSPSTAWTFYGSATTHTNGVAAWSGQAPELTALARSLGAERLAAGEISAAQFTQNVFDYVRNNIDVEFRFGLGKGARGALIDQSGTPFDQADLMVRLLRAGGVAASYQIGTITLSAQQFGQWSGLVYDLNEASQSFKIDARAACRLLADGAIPALVDGASDCNSTAGEMSNVTLGHIWVSANGVLYDPSFKVHHLSTGIDIPAAMGCGTEASSTCGTALTNAAMSGAMTGTENGLPYIRNVNETALNSQLQTAAVSLQTQIQNNNRLAFTEEIVGGPRLVTTPTPAISATLPYSFSAQVAIAGDIPDQYRTRLRVRFRGSHQTSSGGNENSTGADLTFFADELAGRRLQLFGGTVYDQDRMVLDSSILTAPTCAACGGPTLSVDHPYVAQGGTYADEEMAQPLWDNGTYPVTIVLGLGSAGPGTERHFAALQEALPYTAASESVIFDVLTIKTFQNSDQVILAARLLSQGALADRLVSGISDASITRHHDFGILYAHYYNPAAVSYMSVRSAVSVAPVTNDTTARSAAFETVAASWAMLEGSVSAQLNNYQSGLSTVSLFRAANQQGWKFYQLTSTQLSSSIPASVPNSMGSHALLQSAGAAGYGAILVEHSSVEILTRSNSTGYTIAAAIKGGGSITNDPVSAAANTVAINDAAAPRRRYASVSPADGAATITATDMVVGAGEFPVALPLQRTYRSDVTVIHEGTAVVTYTEDLNLTPGSRTDQTNAVRYSASDSTANSHLGGGWSHNWNVTASLNANGAKALGLDYGIEASGSLAVLRSIFDAAKSPTFANRLAIAFAENWLQRSFAYNSAVIDTGGSTQGFQRLPNGTFFTPRGDARLVQNGQPTVTRDFTPVTLDYTGRDGDVIHFDWSYRSQQPWPPGGTGNPTVRAEPRFKATSWSFPDGTVITFEYTGQFLVSSYIPEAMYPPVCGLPGGGPGQCTPTPVNNLPYGYVLTRVSNNRGHSLTFDSVASTVGVPGLAAQQPGTAYYPVAFSFRISRVTDENGRHVDYATPGPSCSGGSLACDTFTVTDPTGAVTRYEYAPDENSPNSAAVRPFYHLRRIFTPALTTGPYETILYDELFRVRRVTDAMGHATNYYPGSVAGAEIWRRGETASPLSTPSTPVVTVNIFDEHNSLLSATDPLGRVTRNEYDRVQRQTRAIYPELNEERRAYDVRSNPLEVRRIAKPGSELDDIVTSISYMEGPSVITCVNPVTCNRPQIETDARNYRTRYTWDASSGLLTRMETGLDSANACAVRDPYNNPSYPTGGSFYCPVTDLSYSLFGPGGSQFRRLTARTDRISSADATGLVTTYAYNAANKYVLQSATVDPGGLNLTTALSFDGVGNLTQIDGPRTDVADITNATWDPNRRLRMRIEPDPDGAGTLPRPAVRLNYSDGGLLTSRENGTTTSATGANFTAAETTTFALDPVGRRVRTTAPAGVTQFSYDAEDRPTCTAVRMNPALYGSLPTGVGAACQLTTPGANGADRITRMVYDAAGQLLVEQRAYGIVTPAFPQSLQQDYATYAYTPNGQRDWIEDANGNRSDYSYDGFDRLSRLTFPSPTTDHTVNAGDYEEYGYDPNGNRTSLRLRSGEPITFSYDALNREVLKDFPASALNNPDVYTAYDLMGRKLYARFGAGAANANCGASTTGADYCYDRPGRLTAENAYGRALTYQIDAAGNRTRLTFPYPSPTGDFIQYTYDAMNRMDQVRENGATAGAGLLADYAYDTRGRREGVARASSAGAQTALAYDGASRVSSSTQNLASTDQDLTFAFGYNPASQVLSRTLSNDAYRYPVPAPVNRSYASNGLNQYTNVSGAALDYDARGNLTSDGSRRFCYDLENRLIGVAPQSGNACTGATFRLSYDPLGRLRETAAGSTVTQFLYSGDQLVGEFSGASTTPLRRYAHGAGVDEPLVWWEGAALTDRRWLHTDHQGSIIATSNASGARNETVPYSYSPYGEPDAVNLWTGSRFRYTGQIALPEAGLYHYKARVYDPGLGRFLQTDPVGYEDGLNLYAYVRNDPLNFSDPSGRQTAASGIRPPPDIPRDGEWRWAPNPQNSRGGTWVDDGGRSASWEEGTRGNPGGHWDVDQGDGNRQRYSRFGAPLTAQEAHGYRGPVQRNPIDFDNPNRRDRSRSTRGQVGGRTTVLGVVLAPLIEGWERLVDQYERDQANVGSNEQGQEPEPEKPCETPDKLTCPR